MTELAQDERDTPSSPATTSMRSSSGPVSQGCTCCTGCATRCGSRRGCSRRPTTSAARGTSTATRVPGATRRATSTASRTGCRRTCSRSGRGASGTRRSRRSCSYLRHVADRFDLRKDIQFGTRVVAAEYDDAAAAGRSRTDDGGEVTATVPDHRGRLPVDDQPARLPGPGQLLRATRTTRVPGRTRAWTSPASGSSVIGTGATAVQAIPEIAEQAAHVTVLQRTANYDIAGGNRPMDAEDGRRIKDNYREIWQATRETGFGFPYPTADRTAHVGVGRGATADLRGGLGEGRVPARDDLQRPAPRRAGERDGRGVPPGPDPGAGDRPGDRRAALAPRTTRSSPSARPWRTATTRRSTGRT